MKTKLHPYLNFSGTCEEAINFYQTVLGGKIEHLSRYSEMPPQDGVTVSEDMKNKILHIYLRINEETVIMGSDTGGDWAPEPTIGNNISLSLSTKSKNEADKFFHGLSSGGKITMPIGDTFWGDYFGMCIDKFGINWMIGFNENQ